MKPLALVLALLTVPALAQDNLETVAESSDFQRTASSEEVLELAERLAEHERVTLTELGRSHEDRPIPLLIVADPPIEDAETLADSDRLVCLFIGNIHAGEVCGKEALMMLTRELALADEPGVLDHVALAIVPNYNPDGNDRFSPDNRPQQHGPDGGVGTRANALDLDLNRDYVKLESPETRALLRFINDVDPTVIVDTHTTNGSHHRYTLTYDANKHPASDRQILEYTRETMLPAISRTVKADHDWDTFWYGNFDRHKTTWSTYPAVPRFGTPYRGLRSRVAILTEAYAYAPYEDRVLCTLDFCRAIAQYAADNAEEIHALVSDADDRTIEAGRDARSDDLVPIRLRPATAPGRVTIPGYVEKTNDDATTEVTKAERDYSVAHSDRFESALSVVRPRGYVILPGHDNAVETLQRHGIDVRQLREDIELDIEVSELTEVSRAERPFQGHNLVSLDARVRERARMIPAGSHIVWTDQKLGTLACLLLEPRADDSLATWGFFDASLETGADFPVMRLMSKPALLTAPATTLPEDREFDRAVTFENVYEPDDAPNLSGSAARIRGWLNDNTYLQVKNGVLNRVDADTGRARRFVNAEKLAGALTSLPTISRKDAGLLARTTRFNWTDDRRSAVFNHQNDLYFARLDGSFAVRLTATPEAEELAEPSPDGRFVAFVRDNDLWVVDVTTRTERALTSGGSDTLRCGKASWVYFEEIFGRSWKAWWWSPDSTRIAFFETDSSMVNEYSIIDNRDREQDIETTRYPRPGEPNPHVRVGVVDISGGSPRWLDLSGYDPGRFLVTRVTWEPDSKSTLVCVQDRAQTWLDLLRVSTTGDATKLFRETTGAWVRRMPEPIFLDDDSMLIMSERDGWAHIYRYSNDGELIEQITSGEWEVRAIHAIDEDEGWIYLTGTYDSHIAENLYRVRLHETEISAEPERLTHAPGHHRVSVSPHGKRFVSTHSDHTAPDVSVLYASKGAFVRTLDTNPVPARDEFVFGDIEFFTIPMEDGFELEAYTIKPPGFDPTRKHPVIFLTYGGPHASTVHNSWRGGRVFEHLLATAGYVVFRTDPRSASEKGAVSAWTSYGRFGALQVEDLSAALEWLSEHDWVDPERIGMHGHSFGGTMTLSMMVNTELIRAGIAGAPVTDWRDYDTIYTERYMKTPQENPEGYRETSIVEHAENLSGRLLLTHGLRDDNVHMQNSTRLIQALHDAGKQFDLMVYPANRHGIWGDHYTRRRLDFFERELEPGKLVPIESESVGP